MIAHVGEQVHRQELVGGRNGLGAQRSALNDTNHEESPLL